MGRGATPDERYVFLDYLRACAAWLVVWGHLGTVMPGWTNQVFGPAAWLRDNFTGPLGIIQDFGWFGVALFFLISGFIISDRARVETAAEFVLRRVLRIYPMLFVAVAISAAFVFPKPQITLKALLTNLTLVNYYIHPQVVMVGVAWTLVIEVIFYALTTATQFARGSPHRIAFNLAVVAACIWKYAAFGTSFALFAGALTYLPVLVMGQTVYWWLSRGQLSTAWGLGYLLAAYGVFLWGLRVMQPGFVPVTNSYAVSVAYALLLFIAMMRAPLRERRLVRFLSDTSYSMYLLHGLIGALVLGAVMKVGPLWLAIAAAAAVSLAASYAAYRLVEIPFQRLARKLSRALPPPLARPVPQTAE